MYYIKHVQTTFYHESGWPEILCLIEVSTMFYIYTYCLFTLRGITDNVICNITKQQYQL